MDATSPSQEMDEDINLDENNGPSKRRESSFMAGFMFGNVDEEGHLELDFLDEETKSKLTGLQKVLEHKIDLDNDNVDDDDQDDDFDPERKADDAEDYSTLNEALSDDSSSSDDDGDDEDEDNDHDNKDVSNKEESSGSITNGNNCNDKKSNNSDSEDKRGNFIKQDVEQEITEQEKKDGDGNCSYHSSTNETSYGEERSKNGESNSTLKKELPSTDPDIDQEGSNQQPSDKELMPPPPPGLCLPAKHKEPVKKPSRKPLAAMLPTKYKDVDVRELFPEFRPDSVLRFSRLFPIKASHRPKIWKNLIKAKKSQEKPTKNVKKEEGDGHNRDAIDIKNEGQSDKRLPWFEDPKNFAEDDYFRLIRAVEPKNSDEDWSEQSDEENINNENKTGLNSGSGSNGSCIKKGPKQSDWRSGPAQYWYDLVGVPENVREYTYGFKASNQNKVESDSGANENSAENTKVAVDETSKIEFPDEAFLMVTQTNWEDDVIWNGDDIKHKVMQKLHSKSSNNAAGWVPTGINRTAGSFSQPGKTSGLPMSGIKLQTMQTSNKKAGHTDPDDTFYSIFPVENEELAYGRWEDEVIWDTNEMPVRLTPKIVSLDPNDDNIILGLPDDVDPSTLPSDRPVKKVKIIQKHVKKSRMLLNRSGIISVIEEESPPPPPKTDDKDPFNLSNDEYYLPKAQDHLIKVATAGAHLQHGTPVVELRAPFVPTHLGPAKLRTFHRWPLKRLSHGTTSTCVQFHGVQSLQKIIKKKEKMREQEREAAGGGEIFFMRTADDISGKDGDLILMEYMEEHPPMLSLVGMASKFKNYFKKRPGVSDDNEGQMKKHRYGDLCPAHTSPFLGQMAPGQNILTLENNMYRAPIYEHTAPASDFLIIRTRSDFSIREIDALFVVGQECPLYEVPGPNSKKANNFARDFLQVFIYRLFWSSRDSPRRRIKMDDIKKAFPDHSESSIRKRLKPCAEFHRTGVDSNWWVLKPNFRLPTEEEMRAMVTPEQCCANFSMIEAEQRLRDAGYGEKFMLTQQDEDDEDTAMKMDDEVKVAPWNTTRAYILAMKGKCLLQLTGPADPTGPAGEGFSYVRIPNKPTNKDEADSQPKRTVTGTNADLRKLNLSDARNILRTNGVPEEAIMKLSRWEVIDVVRTLSTEKVKAGEEGDHRFSRGNRFSIAEHQERYREECQRIFEVQNKVLASSEVLSSDEAESSEEGEDNDDQADLDEMGKNIEKMLSNKKSSSQVLREREEAERRKLQQMILEGAMQNKDVDKNNAAITNTAKKGKKAGDPESTIDLQTSQSKVLKITRVFRNLEGKEYTRTEMVRKPLVIEAYVKVRETKDEAFIKQFASPDESAKEEMKKERRRLQEQLRRIKRNKEKNKMGLQKSTKKQQQQQQRELQRLAKEAAASTLHQASAATGEKTLGTENLKVRCGACGIQGHMRTNRACPKFDENLIDDDDESSVNVAMTEQDEEEMEKDLLNVETTEGEELVNVDGTKMKVNAKVLKHADELRKRTMILKVPKKTLRSSTMKKRKLNTEHCDYLSSKSYKPIKRRRTDPIISLASFLEALHSELRSMDEALQFLQPVNTRKVPDYLDKVKTPMDLQTIKDNIHKKKYHSREDFLADVKQISENSAIYNGEADLLTLNANKLFERVVEKFAENEDKLMRLEKAINPLLDDNDQVALTYIFKNILDEKIKSMQESWPFVKPVNRKQMKHYYDIIKNPMDLETVAQKIEKQQYHSRQDFLSDIELIYNNSLTFNGSNSEYTLKAKKILDVTQETLDSYADHVMQLEERIQKVKARVEQEHEDESGSSNSRGRQLGSKGGKKKPISQEFVSQDDDDSQHSSTLGNVLEDDLQCSSENEDDDDEFEEEDDPTDLDFEPVNEDSSTNLTVTIQPQEQDVVNIREFYHDFVAEDQETMEPSTSSVMATDEFESHVEEQVDEDYDPTDFLHNLGGSGGVDSKQALQTSSETEVTATIEMPVFRAGVDVVNDDLNISDSDEEDNKDVVIAPPRQPPSFIPPFTPRREDKDDDGLWF